MCKPQLAQFAAVVPMLALVTPVATTAEADDAATRPPTSSEVLEASSPADWQALDPARTLYLDLPAGRVVFRLAPEFAPRHVDNLRILVRQRYFDGLAIIRAQDNYVVQWGDPAGGESSARTLGAAAPTLAPEFFRGRADLPFTAIDSRDAYADEVGFVDGFPVARDASRVWLAHCYGMLGAGRANEADSGNAAELYAVTGHAPRHLDRNVTLIGRAVLGVELLSALPRGSGPLGFYADASGYTPIVSMRLASELPADERVPLEYLKTDTSTFARFVDTRRHRREDWFVDPVGRIELCNVPLPVRIAAQ